MKKKFLVFITFILIFSLIQFASDKKKQSTSNVKPVKPNTKIGSVVKDIIKFYKPNQGYTIYNPTFNGKVVTLYSISAGPGPFNIYLYDVTKTKLIKKLYSNTSNIRYVKGIIGVLKSVKGGNYTLKATNANNEQIIGFSKVFRYINNNPIITKKKVSVLKKRNVRKKN